MKHRLLSLASVALMTGLLLPACQMQNWEVPNHVSARHAVIERHPELVPLRLYIPNYLSEGPSQSERFLLPPPHMVIDAFKKKIESQNESFEVTEVPPDTGLFCSLRLEELEISGPRRAWNVLTSFTLSLIPFYDDSLGYTITYEVFVDAKLKKRYQYMVRGKHLEWIAAFLTVPFMSSRWHIEDPKYGSVSERLLEELLSTSRLFVDDARKDGIVRMKIAVGS